MTMRQLLVQSLLLIVAQNLQLCYPRLKVPFVMTRS